MSAVDLDDFDFDRVKPLLRAVVARESDEKIWAQVYYTIAESTPSSRNMGSLVNSSERRNDTDPVVKKDLGLMYVDIPQLYETFFGGITELESASQTIFKQCCEGSDPYSRDRLDGRDIPRSLLF
ncbi:hypothetical protein GGR54DRAFT_490937 [Hypoxylon sp. NC1633]|nr:hypothetical protein GGR54DRAFT_490937 [Hypoxylon sp. NC1633]